MNATQTAVIDLSQERAIRKGEPFLKLPKLLTEYGSRLGLSRNQILLVANVMVYQWEDDRLPYPGEETLASRMGCSTRMIRIWKADLKAKGLLTTRRRHRVHTDLWDFGPLWTALRELRGEDVGGPDRGAGVLRLGTPGDAVAKCQGTSEARPGGVVPTGSTSPVDRKYVSCRQEVDFLQMRSILEEDLEAPPRAELAGDSPSQEPRREGLAGNNEEEDLAAPAGPAEPGDGMGMSEKVRRAAEAAALAKAQSVKDHEAERKKAAARRARRESSGGGSPKPKAGASIRKLEAVWHAEYEAAFPGIKTPRWGKEYGNAAAIGQAHRLLLMYGERAVADAFRYVCQNWPTLRERMFKGKGGPAPGLGLLVKCHDMLFPEATVWGRHAAVIAERDAFWKENPYAIELPADLRGRAEQAEKELKASGQG